MNSMVYWYGYFYLVFWTLINHDQWPMGIQPVTTWDWRQWEWDWTRWGFTKITGNPVVKYTGNNGNLTCSKIKRMVIPMVIPIIHDSHHSNGDFLGLNHGHWLNGDRYGLDFKPITSQPGAKCQNWFKGKVIGNSHILTEKKRIKSDGGSCTFSLGSSTCVGCSTLILQLQIPMSIAEVSIFTPQIPGKSLVLRLHCFLQGLNCSSNLLGCLLPLGLQGIMVNDR